MKNKKIFFCSAFKYVVPAEYEQWFEELATTGWHPVKIGQLSSIAMRFEKSEPRKYRYVVDMQPTPKKNYKQTYEDFGWEYVGKMASAYVWRKEYTNERPESFSDNSSLKARNNRFIVAISVSFIIFLLSALAFLAGAIFSNFSSSERLQFGIASALFFVIAVLLGLAMVKINKNIDK